jgi:hypothetical protein
MQPSGDWRQLPAAHERADIVIDAKTAATSWDGSPMNYEMAIDYLMYLWRDVSAQTS